MNFIKVSVISFLVLMMVGGVVGGTTNVAPLDDDSLTPIEEYQHGTSMTTADTDEDGVTDGEEVRQGTDPTRADTDSDGLTDGEEQVHGTDPTVADTDGDGIDDATEVTAATSATKADTDNDGLNDGEEQSYGTNATIADTDEDGLDDGAEVNVYETDPTVADTDTDGLKDGREVTETETDPALADTDDDGLNDSRELEEQTNPRIADTDKDGLEDGKEIEIGADPHNVDTDDDGIEDGPEYHNTELYPNASPVRTDIYIEVDEMEGEELPEEEAERVAQAYADAPVENPDGSTGITVHFIYNETVDAQKKSDGTDMRAYYRNDFDRKGDGYHYLLVANDVYNGGVDVLGIGGSGIMMIEARSTEDKTGHITMHEMGHSLGLFDSDFEGVDSRQYSYEDYPSVMNYNSARDSYGYSSGGNSEHDFNDWAYIAENMYTPP